MTFNRVMLFVVIALVVVAAITYFALVFGANGGVSYSPAGCTDTDGGLNYAVKGTVFVQNNISGTDFCNSGTQLGEYYCYTPNAINLAVAAHDCSPGQVCSDGACVAQQNSCTDSDGGTNFYVGGIVVKNGFQYLDKCYNSTRIEEQSCSINNGSVSTQADCPAGTTCQIVNGLGQCSQTSIFQEEYPLFGTDSGTQIYLNDSIGKNTDIKGLTNIQLPVTLASGVFNGTKYWQSIFLEYRPPASNLANIMNNPLVYSKAPTYSDNPNINVQMRTAYDLYNEYVHFENPVNFVLSKGKTIKLFGKDYTVDYSTDNTHLVLLEDSVNTILTSNALPFQITTKASPVKTYTVSLVSASTTDATIRVMDEMGNRDTKSVSEFSSRKILDLYVAVTNADSNNLSYTASLIIATVKLNFSVIGGGAVKKGENEMVINGTSVEFYDLRGPTNRSSSVSAIIIRVFAPDSDHDAIKEGQKFVDPVFGTFKIDFRSLNSGENGVIDREDIKIEPLGDNQITATFSPHYVSGQRTFIFANSIGSSINTSISTIEMEKTYRNGFIMIGNGESGRLVKVSTISNDSSTSSSDNSSDNIVFTDVFSGETITAASPSQEGTTNVIIGGKSYVVYYGGVGSSDSNWVRLNYPDSAGNNAMIVYPTLKTSKGAKVSLYKRTPPTSLYNWDGRGNVLSTIKFPNGNGYTSINVSNLIAGDNYVDVGKIKYVIKTDFNNFAITLIAPDSNGLIYDPALIIFEGKGGNNDYQAMIVTLDGGSSSTNGLDVSDVIRTWGNDAVNDKISMPGNSFITKEADLWGSIITTDSSTPGHTKATISYPDNQVYAKIYALGVASSAQVCGNGIKEGTEQCDGSIPRETSCQSLGFISGTLGCVPPGRLNSCKFDTAKCSLCGNGVINRDKGETCDDGNLRSGDGCSSTCRTEGGGGGKNQKSAGGGQILTA